MLEKMRNHLSVLLHEHKKKTTLSPFKYAELEKEYTFDLSACDSLIAEYYKAIYKKK